MDVGGQASSFKLLGGGYAGTQMFAFYKGEKSKQCVNPEKVMGAYLICMGGSVFFEGSPVQASQCINPKKYLGHGFLECYTTYLYNGQKLSGPSPQYNQLKITAHGTAVDKRGKEYGESVEKEIARMVELKKQSRTMKFLIPMQHEMKSRTVYLAVVTLILVNISPEVCRPNACMI